MASVESFNELIDTILTGKITNAQRREYEKQLKSYSEVNPNEFITIIFKILKSSPKAEIRQFCASQIRQNLSNYSESIYKNIWSNLNNDIQRHIQIELFELLQTETASNVRRLIADALGEIGASLITVDDENQVNRWPDLIPELWKLFLTEAPSLVQCGFRILGNLIVYSRDSFDNYLNELHELFQKGMSNDEFTIKVGAVQALASLITVSEAKVCRQFDDLCVLALDTSLFVLLKDNDVGQGCLEALADIADTEARFYKKSFEVLLKFVQTVVSSKDVDDNGLKRLATEIIITVLERQAKIIRSNSKMLGEVIEIIFVNMITIEKEIPEQWKTPKEGYCEDFEDDDDFEATRFGMSCIDRLIGTIGQKQMLPVLSTIVQGLLSHSDWRYVYAAIMALSQVGEYIEDVDQIEPVVKVIVNFSKSENCMIRYSVCHALGQISDDMEDKLQQKFGLSILEVLVDMMETDPIPRVSSHAIASLTNYIEGMQTEMFAPVMENILGKVVQHLNGGISMAQENAITCVAVIAEAGGEAFYPFFEKTIEFIFKIIETHPAQQYRLLRGQGIETVTILAHVVDNEKFIPYFEKTIDMLIQTQKTQIEEVDPQKTFVLNGWQRLVTDYPMNIKQYLPNIIPSLLQLVKDVLNLSKQVFEEDPEDEEEKVNAYQMEEAEIAISMIDCFTQKMGVEFIPYVENVIQIIAPLTNFRRNETVRNNASQVLPKLINCVKENKEVSSQLGKYFIQLLLEAAKTQIDTDMIISQIMSTKQCIDNVGKFLSDQELGELTERIIQFLKDSDERKKQSTEFQLNDPEIDDEEKELCAEGEEAEEDLHVAIAELIGVLFKTHKEQTVNFANMIYSQILPRVFGQQSSDKLIKFGIFLIDDMTEFLGYEYLSDKWSALCEALIQFANSKTCFIRQAANYGLGIFAQSTPPNIFGNFVNPILNAISEALKIQKEQDEKDKIYHHARDNIISSLGKIIKFQHQSINLKEVIQGWINLLPFKHDKVQSRFNNDLLLDIILNNPDIVFINNEAYFKVLKIYATIYDTKICNDSIKNQMAQSIQILATNPIVTGSWDSFYSTLTDSEKQKIVELSQL